VIISVLLEDEDGNAEVRPATDWKHFAKKWTRVVDIWESVSAVLEVGFATKEAGQIAVYARNNKDGEPDTDLAKQEVERYVLSRTFLISTDVYLAKAAFLIYILEPLSTRAASTTGSGQNSRRNRSRPSSKMFQLR